MIESQIDSGHQGSEYTKHQMMLDSFPERTLCEREIDLSDRILRGAVEFDRQSFLFLGSKHPPERKETALSRWKALGQPRLEFAFLADSEDVWVERLEKILDSLDNSMMMRASPNVQAERPLCKPVADATGETKQDPLQPNSPDPSGSLQRKVRIGGFVLIPFSGPISQACFRLCRWFRMRSFGFRMFLFQCRMRRFERRMVGFERLPSLLKTLDKWLDDTGVSPVTDECRDLVEKLRSGHGRMVSNGAIKDETLETNPNDPSSATGTPAGDVERKGDA